jgi:hypothetical protein
MLYTAENKAVSMTYTDADLPILTKRGGVDGIVWCMCQHERGDVICRYLWDVLENGV